MGWEYHERTRDRYGRFAARGGRCQVHLRLTQEQADMLHNGARAAAMELSAYVWACLDAYWASQVTAHGDNTGTSGGSRTA